MFFRFLWGDLGKGVLGSALENNVGKAAGEQGLGLRLTGRLW